MPKNASLLSPTFPTVCMPFKARIIGYVKGSLSGHCRQNQVPQHFLYFLPDPHEQGSFLPGRSGATTAGDDEA